MNYTLEDVNCIRNLFLKNIINCEHSNVRKNFGCCDFLAKRKFKAFITPEIRDEVNSNLNKCLTTIIMDLNVSSSIASS